MYRVQVRAASRPGLSGPDTDTSALEQQFASAIQQLHAIAVSLSDMKTQYERTGDPRYLESVRTMAATFQRQLQVAQGISAQLTDADMPSSFELFIANIGMWLGQQTADAYQGAKDVLGGVTGTVKKLPDVAGAIANPFVLLAIAGVAFMALGGNRLIPRGR